MQFHRHLIVFAVALSSTSFFSYHAAAESWTSLRGSRIEAKMIGLWNESVVLESDGRRIVVRLVDLEAGSRIQAQELAAQRAQHVATIVKEFEGKALEAAAPAPNPLPRPPAAPPYVPLPAGSDAVSTLDHFFSQTQNGHSLLIAFDSLPPSYRKEISDLAKTAASKVNPVGWNSVIKSIHSIGDLIVTRQRWLFSHPRILSMEPGQQDALEDIVLSFGGFVRDGLNPSVMDITKLQTMPLRRWLEEVDRAIAPHIAQANNISGGAVPSFELVSEKEGVASIKTDSGSFDMIKVEDYWLPQEMVDEWTEGMTKLKDEISSVPNGTLLSGPEVAMLPGAIAMYTASLTSAADEQRFHVAMDGVFEQAAPAITSVGMLAGMGPPGRGGRGRGGRGEFDQGGYEDDLYEDQGYGMEDEGMEDEGMEDEGMEDEGMDRADYERQMSENQ